MQTIVFSISGMSCAGCVNSVSHILQAQPGVKRVEVSLADATARIGFDPTLVDVHRLRQAVESAGYRASLC